MKRLLIIIFIFLVIFFAFVATKNIVVNKLLDMFLEKELEVNINIRDLDVSLLGGHIRIEGLTIDNPQGFPKREFVYIPSLEIVCNPFEYLKTKKLYVYFLDLNIERINIIKNEDGTINLKQFKVLERKESNTPPFLLIDMFRLRLDDVYFIEYSLHHKPILKRYNVNIKDIGFGNLNSFEDVVKLIVLKIISQTDIGKLINISIAPFVEDTKDIILLTGKTIKDTLKGIFGLPFIFKNQK